MMKKFTLVLAAACFAGSVAAEGRLLRSFDFEKEAGLQKWPGDAVMELDPEAPQQGKSSIVFTPDNNYVAYFYQNMVPGREYAVKFWYKADKLPIKRCGILLNFTKKGGKNGDAGTQLFSLADFGTANDEWHEQTLKFTAPPETANCQVQLAFYRTNATVNIDNLRLYDAGAPAAESVAPGKVVSTGKLLKQVDFASAAGLQKWPVESVFDLRQPDGKDGRAAIAFMPDSSYSAYFYQQLAPGEYSIEFDWKANETPIARCAMILFFTSKGGKRGDLGNTTVPLSTLGEADGGWKHASFKFTVPANAGASQVMMAMYRTNTPVYIADLKIFQEAPAAE